MSRQEDFHTQSDKYVEMRKSFGVNDPYALKEIGEAYYQGAEHGYQYAFEKACEFIRLHICVDIPVRLTPDGQPLAEDFFNKAEARANAAQNVVEQFKQFMEK